MFNNAQQILGVENTAGKHNLSFDQLNLCVDYAIDEDTYTSDKHVVIVFRFPDGSILRHILSEKN